ncbi:baseplate J/gp47 family protein [Paenibacillus periandrae]|uniref:baseplate J/gp47 family protein n=1 Tax=Paenibacillus periandrae TaxID=1761741 RepID=UPI001F08EFAB|nr:baseplate J/gp47 family protein [Paenibacillus periandrae]
MYENQTFQAIMTRMLAVVPNDVDKREGSVVYDALAPAAWELKKMYSELDANINLSFADTSSGEYLERRTAEFGVEREQATKARRKGLFYGASSVPFDVPIGSRYAANQLNYVVMERLSTGVFVLECETTGTVGNQYFGPLLPIDYVNGLSSVTLSDVLVPGEDTETDTALRQRYFAILNEQPFGGNIADYKQKIGEIPGVGGVKIFPAWAGGGTVKATIITSDYSVPSPELIDEIQTAIDPVINSGEGIGFAPIGHSVTITGVSNTTINVETTLTLSNGVTIGQVQDDIQSIIGAYLLTLRQSWAAEKELVVRVAQIEARILAVWGVTDIIGTMINGDAANITLSGDQIPVLGTVVLHG